MIDSTENERSSANNVGVIVLAAGSSTRMGDVDKQLLDLRGLPVFLHSVKAFEASDRVSCICVVFSTANLKEGKQAIVDAGLAKVSATVTGGERRQDSVRIGIDALESESIDWLVVHDAARPFVDEVMIERGLAAATETSAAVAAMPMKDTVKEVDGNRVVATPDRDSLQIVQTPQIFRASTLRSAHASVDVDVTDDASMVERGGGSVTVFEGSYDNIKITTPGDVVLAEAIFDRRSGQPRGQVDRRWGVGFDGHALTDGGPLRLGGVEIEFDKHLEGHSDGDVLLHAVTSALLGAAGLGDMGSNFPSSDRSLAGIDSMELLARALVKIRSSHWEPDHLDATIIAQRPRLSGHVAAIRERLATATGLAVSSVNVKVTSTDHVGAIGEGKGVAAQAVATLRSF